MPGDLTVDPGRLFAPLLGRAGVGLAVSGGPDSLALLLLAAEWRRGGGDVPPLFVYSVDHGLRPEAADEVRFVVAEAARRGLPARALTWIGAKPATGIQAAARRARYGLIREAMAGDGADVLVTAHHLADQAETVLMRLAHGSGVEGLRGMDRMAVVEGCTIFRPLLGVTPELLHRLVADAGLTAVSDPSNWDTDYERVRWRTMLPQLADLGLDAARLGTFARRMGEVDAMLEAQAEAALGQLVRRAEARAELDAAALAGLARPIAVRLLGRLLAEIGGNRKPRALGVIEALHDKLIAGATLKRTSLHGCLVSRDGAAIVVAREPARWRPAPSAATVTRN